ncbi:MAG TPA: DUF4157 domain-containing protein [Longimicrobium sp.]|nr:DUF4157 domain-containing protein [Longimicrobium sp.]
MSALSPLLARAPAPAPVLRRRACGGRTADAAEGAAKRLRRSASGEAPSAAPAIVHDVLRSPGTALDAGTRAAMEPRFGHSFADVRVHADGRAAESAAAVGAHAYAVGRDVVFGAGRYAPSSADGRRLIAHELAHVVQQSGSAGTVMRAPLLVGRADAPEEREADAAAERAVAPVPAFADGTLRRTAAPRVMRQAAPAGPAYPTVEQGRAARGVLDPTEPDGTLLPLERPDEFRAEVARAVEARLDANLVPARARASSTATLEPALPALADLAQQRAEAKYGGDIPRAPAPAAQAPTGQGAAPATQGAAPAAPAAPRLRDHLHRVSEVAPDVDRVACSWVSDRMVSAGGGLMRTHHVYASSEEAKASCGAVTCPAPAAAAPVAAGGAQGGNRDQAFFQQVRDDIFCRRRADLAVLMLNDATFERGGEVFFQTRIAPVAGEAASVTERRERWRAVGTLLHEMMHTLAHERFDAAVRPLRESGIAVEGFAEYFARPVYDELRAAAAEAGSTVRGAVEGPAAASAPFDVSLAAPRAAYQGYVDGVHELLAAVGGNEQNLRAAFFRGEVEYLGLGGWNEAEARRREAARQPRSFGVAGVLFPAAGGSATTGGVRLDYGQVVLGQGGNLQLTLGGGIQYLSEGSVFELGPTAAVRYRWPNLFVEARVGVMAGGGMSEPLERSYRLDVIPQVTAGVQLGMVRLGGGPVLMIPLAAGPVADRSIRLGGMVGLSIEWGAPTPAPGRRDTP